MKMPRKQIQRYVIGLLFPMLFQANNIFAAHNSKERLKLKIVPVRYEYQVIETNKITNYSHLELLREKSEARDNLEKTFNKNVTKPTNDEFDVNVLNESICRSIKNRLINIFQFTEKDESLTIEVSVTKTDINSLYGARLIADTVIYKGIMNKRTLFSGEFKQNYRVGFSLTTIKTPEQIGTILSKRILKDIKSNVIKHE